MLILPKFIYRVNAIPKIQNPSKVDFNCRLPGSSVYGILQAKIPEWVAVPFSRESSQVRDQTQLSCLAGRLSTTVPTFIIKERLLGLFHNPFYDDMIY